MRRYKIPQNVQIEDKIFGNVLTLRQLIMIGIGGGITYVMYTILATTYDLNFIAIGVLCIPFFISVAFSFIKIGPLTLFQYTLLFFEYVLKPERRVWTKQGAESLEIAKAPVKVVTKKDKKGEKDKKHVFTKENLENLTAEDKKKALEQLSGSLDFSKNMQDHPFK